MTARVCHHQDQPWLVIVAPPHTTGADPIVIYDGPLNLTTKTTTKAEIDWAHERSGMPRPDLYDAIRLYERSARATLGAKPIQRPPARATHLKGAA
jgi:hypothetical protein